MSKAVPAQISQRRRMSCKEPATFVLEKPTTHEQPQQKTHPFRIIWVWSSCLSRSVYLPRTHLNDLTWCCLKEGLFICSGQLCFWKHTPWQDSFVHTQTLTQNVTQNGFGMDLGLHGCNCWDRVACCKWLPSIIFSFVCLRVLTVFCCFQIRRRNHHKLDKGCDCLVSASRTNFWISQMEGSHKWSGGLLWGKKSVFAFWQVMLCIWIVRARLTFGLTLRSSAMPSCRSHHQMKEWRPLQWWCIGGHPHHIKCPAGLPTKRSS